MYICNAWNNVHCINVNGTSMKMNITCYCIVLVLQSMCEQARSQKRVQNIWLSRPSRKYCGVVCRGREEEEEEEESTSSISFANLTTSWEGMAALFSNDQQQQQTNNKTKDARASVFIRKKAKKETKETSVVESAIFRFFIRPQTGCLRHQHCTAYANLCRFLLHTETYRCVV